MGIFLLNRHGTTFQLLMNTKNEENQIWVLFVYKQIPYDDENISDDKRKK